MTIAPREDGPRADVEVTFSAIERRRLPSTFQLDVGDRRPVTLTASSRDRQTYTGIIPYDAKVWQRYNAALEASVGAAGGEPGARFEGRVKVSEEPVFTPFLTSGTAKPAAFSPPAVPIVFPLVDPEATLMIIDTDVVEDLGRTFDPCTGGNPMGKWTFNHLMTEMADQFHTGVDPEDLTRNLMETWLSPQTVNGSTIPARPNMQPSSTNGRWTVAEPGISTWPRHLFVCKRSSTASIFGATHPTALVTAERGVSCSGWSTPPTTVSPSPSA